MLKRILLLSFLVVIIIAAALAYRYYRWIYAPISPENRNNKFQIYIEPGQTFEEVVNILLENKVIKNQKSFAWVADKMQFGDQNIKPGHYVFSGIIHNRGIITKLRAGDQTPVDITLTQVRTLEKVAGLIGRQLSFDSLSYITYIKDVYLPGTDYSEDNILSLYIPNTYEVYWTVPLEEFQKRMEEEHGRFWSAERMSKAKILNLTPSEVYTLASILERETQNNGEKPRIAGVYINRLKKNMLLQADPTVIFALGDFTIRRVLKRHLEIDSPYNTYKYPGLPPGPIYMPSISSIDAVLDNENHKYLFFCAKPGYEGEHLFAESLAGHLRNARRYQRWLNSEGIR